MEYVNLKEMTWKEADVRMKEARAVILPLGSTEQHGYHMTIDTDNIVAGHVAGLLAKATDSVRISSCSPATGGTWPRVSWR